MTVMMMLMMMHGFVSFCEGLDSVKLRVVSKHMGQFPYSGELCNISSRCFTSINPYYISFEC